MQYLAVALDLFCCGGGRGAERKKDKQNEEKDKKQKQKQKQRRQNKQKKGSSASGERVYYKDAILVFTTENTVVKSSSAAGDSHLLQNLKFLLSSH
jgi:hypothetical protein